MQTLERLGATDVVAVVTAYRDTLRAHREPINRLNVYPVPDGDTGTNMALTLESVTDAVAAVDPADVAAVASAISHGALMGARGNSGVILSQILRGLADAILDAGGLDAAALAAGLARAADGAYGAVERPMEGTILTVIRAMADGAEADDGGDLVARLEAARAAGADALARTPDLLPVLKAAGVVDSGGTGLLLLADAFLHVVDGRPLPDPDPHVPAVQTSSTGAHGPTRAGEGCRYEVMYLLEAPEESVPSFRSVWAGIGDSIVVVGGDGLYNCHIHTDDIGAAVEAALEIGRPRSIRVTDLWDEVEEERWVREAAADQPPGAGEEQAVPCAVVAVCLGAGVARILRSLGVNRTVTGGQSMNPSTAELLAAIESAPAPEVVVLPNNGNVVSVAEAAAAQSAKTVRVVPTRTVPEGFAALLDYDPEGDAASNAAAMAAAASRVTTGEVTVAVRDSATDRGPVHVGDHIGLTRGRIEVVAGSVGEASIGLLETLIDTDHHELVTVIAGETATAADTRRITSWLAERHDGIGVEVHQGGQPLYPYLFGVE